MRPDLWKEARGVLEQVLEVPREERSSWLERHCEGREELRREVEELLAAEEGLTGFLRPVDGGELSTLLPEGGLARIGPYEIQRVLATGGMGAVYEARQVKPNRSVALKVMRWGVASESVRRRFRDEVEILGRLRHPAIAQVYEAGIHVGRVAGLEHELPYFAMELVEDGLPLNDYVQRHGLGRRERLRLFQVICDAVQHGHQRGVVHRDLKPSNLLVDRSGHPKVIDFGVARLVEDDRREDLTTVGEVVGTLKYMSPEQLDADSAEVDTRTDVYSLGVVLYELLCDVPPFDLEKRSITEAARILHDGRFERPSAVSRGCPVELDWIVSKAMEVDRERRYPSASELRADIQRHLDGDPVNAGPPSTRYRVRKFVERHKVFVSASLAVLLSLAVGLWVSLNLYFTSEELRKDVAEQYERSERLRGDLALQFEESESLRTELGEQLEKVRSAERAAQKEARIASDVSGLFSDILGMASPGALGPKATIEEAVHQTAMSLPARYAHDPERQAIFQLQVGKVFLEMGHLNRAIPELRSALETLRESLPPDDERIIDALIWMARAAADGRDVVQSQELLADALERCSKERGPDDPLTLRVRHQQGSSLLLESRFEEAEEILRDTLERRRRVLGEDSERVHDTMELFATLRLLQGREDEGVRQMQEVLLLRTQSQGATHIATVRTMGALAAFYRRTERFAELEEILEPTLAVCREVLGPEHLTTSSVLQCQASLHEHRKRHDDALAVWDSLVDLRSERLGRDHPSTMTAMRAVAKNLVCLGRLEEAQERLEGQLRILREGSYGERHRATYLAWLELAQVLLRRGEHEAVATRLREVFERAARDLPKNHSIHLGLRRVQVLSLAGVGRVEEALEVLAREKRNSAGNAELAEFLGQTANAAVEVLEAAGREEEARRVREEYGR